MFKKNWFVTTVVFFLSIIAGILILRGGSMVVDSDKPELDWNQLGQLDYLTGKGPAELEAMDGKLVRIPGFMVPLENNQRKVTEFLLVPTPQACIHVPPPPPNQMVLVEMEKGREAEMVFGPIWIHGIIQLRSKRHFYGESSYTMKGVKIEPYQ